VAAAMRFSEAPASPSQMALIAAEPVLTVTRNDVPYNGDDMVVTGKVIAGAPGDEADFLAWLGCKTVKELKGICLDLDIAVPEKAKKADIIDLVTFNTAFPPAEA